MRFARRDRLAIIVIAMAVAVVTAGVILTIGMGAHAEILTAGNEAELTADLVSSPGAAPSDAGLVAPLVEATVDGQPATVIGLPATIDVPGFRGFEGPPDGAVREISGESSVRIRVDQGDERTVDVVPRQAATDPFPREWIVASPELVAELGPDAAFVLDRADTGSASGTAAPGIVRFIRTGIGQLLGLLGIATAGAGLLVGVVTFAVIRMTIRERRRTLGVIRAAGASPRWVAGTLLVRVALLAGIAVGLGYAIGVVLTNALLRVAVTAGWVTSIPTTVTFPVAIRLGAALLGIYLVAVTAGALGGVGALRSSPAGLVRGDGVTDRARIGSVSRFSRVRASLGGLLRAIPRQGTTSRARLLGNGRLFGLETLVVTTAAVTVFVVFVFIIAGSTGAVGPLVGAEGAVLTEAGAAHPLVSSVDASIADAAQAQGIPASAEIIGFGVIDGEPVWVRGANFTAFATIQNATVREGRPPAGSGEVMIGAGVADRLDLGPGDRVPIGGGIRSTITQVRVAGTYGADGYHGEQVLTSLQTARHLARLPDGAAHLIRFGETPTHRGDPGPDIRDVSIPGRVVVGDGIPVTLTVQNPTGSHQSVEVPVTVTADAAVIFNQTHVVEVPAYGLVEDRFTIPVERPGEMRVRVGSDTHSVVAQSEEHVQLEWVPTEAPPNATVTLSLRTATGAPAPDVPVRVGNHSVRSNDQGDVRLSLPGEPGVARIELAPETDRGIAVHIGINPDATRELRADLQVEPGRPTVRDRTAVRATLTNPWAVPVTGAAVVTVGERRIAETVRVAPGDAETLAITPGHQPPGTYTARVRVDDALLVERAYRVRGDEGLAGLVAGEGTLAEGTGIGQGMAWLVGDLRGVLAALLLVAGFATVAGTASVFTRGVQTAHLPLGIRRATGAAPLHVMRRIWRDAFLVAVPAVTMAVLFGWGVVQLLARTGRTTAFGLSLVPVPSWLEFVAIWGGGILVALVGASIAGWVVINRPPARLLRDRES